jgi:hypothetical protein
MTYAKQSGQYKINNIYTHMIKIRQISGSKWTHTCYLKYYDKYIVLMRGLIISTISSSFCPLRQPNQSTNKTTLQTAKCQNNLEYTNYLSI